MAKLLLWYVWEVESKAIVYMGGGSFLKWTVVLAGAKMSTIPRGRRYWEAILRMGLGEMRDMD